MKKWLIGGLIAATVFVPFALGSIAVAGQDECEHGNSGQECVPDPNEHGEDCEEHGQSEGNEDHCLSTTTSTVVPPSTTTTSTTEPPVTTTVTSTVVPTTSTSTTTAPTTSTSAPGPTGTTGPSETTTPVKDSGGGSNEGPSSPPDKLAFTGVEDVVPIVGIMLLLGTLGFGLMWAGHRNK